MAKNLNLEEDDNTVHEGNDVRRWHIATNPKAQNLRSVLMQSGHLWTSGLGRTCSEWTRSGHRQHRFRRVQPYAPASLFTLDKKPGRFPGPMFGRMG